MVIPRKYEWLGILCDNDPASKKVIDAAFALCTRLSKKESEEIREYNRRNIPAFLNIGCGIPGESYQYMIQEFEKLDKTSPYDNGLTFNDVGEIETEVSRKGTAMQMRFLEKTYGEDFYRIIGFAAIENKDSKIAINDGWEMAAPFEIG